MENTELKVIQKQGIISFNKEELKKYIQGVLEEYKGLIYDEANIQTAKKTVASLRADQKAIDDRRILVKKEHAKVLEEFEKDVKEISGLYNAPILSISTQVKEYEDKEKADKKAEIKKYWDSMDSEMLLYLDFNMLYEPAWENKKTTLKSIYTDIDTLVSTTKQEIQTLRDRNSDGISMALLTYKKNLSLTEAMSYLNTFELQKQQILAREEEKKKAAAELEVVRAPYVSAPPLPKQIMPAIQPVPTVTPISPRETVSYEVVGTSFEIQKIELYMNTLGVIYRRM